VNWKRTLCEHNSVSAGCFLLVFAVFAAHYVLRQDLAVSGLLLNP
jgi:hypothetical protein